MKIIGNPDWTNPAVRLKNAIVAPARKALALAGRWTPTSAAERETVQTETLTLSGDRPAQLRLVYAQARPEAETVENLLYTPEGMGAAGGKIVERYSVRAPSLPEILKTPAKAARAIAHGAIAVFLVLRPEGVDLGVGALVVGHAHALGCVWCDGDLADLAVDHHLWTASDG